MNNKHLSSQDWIRIMMCLLVAAGLLCCTEEKTILTPPPDTKPPKVEWVSVNGYTGAPAVVSDTVEIVLSAMDEAGLESLCLFKNGFSPTEWRRASPSLNDTLFTFQWNTLADSDGIYSLEARACDKAGNIGTSPTLTIRVQNHPLPPSDDRTPPDVWFETPVPGATLSDTVRVVVGYFDESGVDSVQLLKDGATISSMLRGGEVRGVVEYLWDTHSDSDGVHLWQARAYDKAGNVGLSISLLVKVKNNPLSEDHQPPIIIWISPQPGSIVYGTVRLCFQALDDNGVDSLRLYVSGVSPTNAVFPGHPSLDYTLEW